MVDILAGKCVTRICRSDLTHPDFVHEFHVA